MWDLLGPGYYCALWKMERKLGEQADEIPTEDTLLNKLRYPRENLETAALDIDSMRVC